MKRKPQQDTKAGKRRFHRLSLMAGAAIFLHCALLYALPAPKPKTPPAQRESVTIELAPPPEEILSPTPEPPPEPEPPKAPEPPQPLKKKKAPVHKEKKRPLPPKEQTKTPVAPEKPKEQTPAKKPVKEMPAAPAPSSKSRNRKPAYPELARRRGQEGVVTLLVQVDEQGRVMSLDIKKSSGFTLLDEAALKGVRQWIFTPATRDGVPVKGFVLVPVAFELK